MLTTFEDAVFHLLDFTGGDNSSIALRTARRAVIHAYSDLHSSHQWSYLTKFDRLVTSAPYSTGTVTYIHTGGTYERQLTISGGTWPTWAKQGTVLISTGDSTQDNIAFEVEDRKSSTVVTLEANTNPGADISTPKTFQIFRDLYTLPADYLSGDDFQTYNQWRGITFVTPREWIFNRVRTNSANSGYPIIYSVFGDLDTLDRVTVRLFPYPDKAYSIDFVYRRKPRSLQILQYKTGTVSLTGGSSTLTGSGTSWNSTMVGSVVRIQSVDDTSASGITETGPYGFSRNAYYVHERRVTAVGSATSITLDSSISETLTAGTKYVISDPVDIYNESMRNAFFRLCEKQVAIGKNFENQGSYIAISREASLMAKEADSRSNSRKQVDVTGGESWATFDQPFGPNVS